MVFPESRRNKLSNDTKMTILTLRISDPALETRKISGRQKIADLEIPNPNLGRQNLKYAIFALHEIHTHSTHWDGRPCCFRVSYKQDENRL